MGSFEDVVHAVRDGIVPEEGFEDLDRCRIRDDLIRGVAGVWVCPREESFPGKHVDGIGGEIVREDVCELPRVGGSSNWTIASWVSLTVPASVMRWTL